jgi:hypothetical protein
VFINTPLLTSMLQRSMRSVGNVELLVCTECTKSKCFECSMDATSGAHSCDVCDDGYGLKEGNCEGKWLYRHDATATSNAVAHRKIMMSWYHNELNDPSPIHKGHVLLWVLCVSIVIITPEACFIGAKRYANKYDDCMSVLWAYYVIALCCYIIAACGAGCKTCEWSAGDSLMACSVCLPGYSSEVSTDNPDQCVGKIYWLLQYK